MQLESVEEKEWRVTRNFILSYSHLVDKARLQGVLLNIDRDISLALIQIHERSLKIGSSSLFEEGSEEEKGAGRTG